MLSREDFIFTIGYDGPAAVIDAHSRKRYGSLSTSELIDKGLFRAAYASAIRSGDTAELSQVAEAYTRFSGTEVEVANLGRLFGVFPVEVDRTIFL